MDTYGPCESLGPTYIHVFSWVYVLIYEKGSSHVTQDDLELTT